jgi:hypothetical protein
MMTVEQLRQHLPLMPDRFAERFARNVVVFGDCWIWIGNISASGYAIVSTLFMRKRRSFYMHRLSVVASGRDIPEGYQVDHLCSVKRCVNPSHLEPVTLAENVFRGSGITAVNRRKDKCLRGHLFTTENTIIKFNATKGKTFRLCRACESVRSSSAYRKSHRRQGPRREQGTR